MEKDIVKRHMEVAFIYSKLSHCLRRKVGCIIVREERIISFGYNQTPLGWDRECEDKDGETYPYVYHAESCAISKLCCSLESSKDASLFVTTIPCYECSKLIVQAKIKEVFYSEYKEKNGIEFLKRSNIKMEKVIV